MPSPKTSTRAQRQVGRNRRAAHREGPDVEAELADPGVLEDLAGDRRHAAEAGDLLLAAPAAAPPRRPTCA